VQCANNDERKKAAHFQPWRNGKWQFRPKAHRYGRQGGNNNSGQQHSAWINSRFADNGRINDKDVRKAEINRNAGDDLCIKGRFVPLKFKIRA
jgi:hypothetical protein